MLRAILAAFLPLITSLTVFAQERTPTTAAECRSLLESSIVDFYLPHCIDQQFGGYLENVNDKGEFLGEEKFLTLQARQVWFFSSLAKAGIRTKESLAAALTGYQFLIQHFQDQRHGGYFTKVTRDGRPIDRRKHVYPLSFVIYSLVAYSEASGDPEPLDQAIALFQVLETHCHDQQHGGYTEFFYEDWREITDENESGYIGAIGTKTYNSHLHLLEAFTSLYRSSGDETVRERLLELVQINTVSVKHPNVACNLDGWNPDWSMIRTPKNLRASYGHDVECVWLVLDAAQALGMPPAMLRGWATGLTDNALEYGFDEEHGGLFYTGPLSKPSDDRKKEWWTQSEALVALLTMQQFTGDRKYREAFDRTFDFVTTYQIASQGGWWATLNPDGSLVEHPSRSSMWHGAYHNGRALLLCEQLLRNAEPTP
ncbi:AGE family epimerase/isomerase [Aureliella helgolandensis]|uniref:Cellobiose 2-epimerase n=1 Tax=Aureliella helgolandensis TaxID=2527968 RepID=A0A518G5B5_9BACT|nr:AGE family epimerase/isomerase [Aureliella helgolandensis]QDV23785.1 Cellobiose 2-epimerase [Aureliella helgolandensis]